MFTRGIKLFRLFGFEVKIDLSWLLLAVLVAWSLAEGMFPPAYPGLSAGTYWWMGIAGALALLLSIVFHEFAHSFIARRYGLPIRGITLFLLGGVAEMEDEPAAPGVEFWMALAGPIASLVLAGLAHVMALAGTESGWPIPLVGVLEYLVYLNLIVAAFNLVPAFPLDGGRMLRSGLWKLKGDIRWATRIASGLGSFFGLALFFLAVLGLLAGNFIGAMWLFLIGLFMRSAANAAYGRVLTRQALEGEPVARFMNAEPVTVPADTNVEDLVEDYVYRYHHKLFPVVRQDRLIGCVTTSDVKKLPRDEWDRHTVAELAANCSTKRRVSPETDAVDALRRMTRNHDSRLMVVDDERLVGVVSLKDLTQFLTLKLDLEEPA